MFAQKLTLKKSFRWYLRWNCLPVWLKLRTLYKVKTGNQLEIKQKLYNRTFTSKEKKGWAKKIECQRLPSLCYIKHWFLVECVIAYTVPSWVADVRLRAREKNTYDGIRTCSQTQRALAFWFLSLSCVPSQSSDSTSHKRGYQFIESKTHFMNAPTSVYIISLRLSMVNSLFSPRVSKALFPILLTKKIF